MEIQLTRCSGRDAFVQEQVETSLLMRNVTPEYNSLERGSETEIGESQSTYCMKTVLKYTALQTFESGARHPKDPHYVVADEVQIGLLKDIILWMLIV